MLVTDSYRNLVIAELGFVAMHTFSSAISMLYPISVVYSTPTTIHTKYKNELSNPRMLDILGFGMIGYSFIIFNTLSVLTGIAGTNMEIEKADRYFSLNTFLWVVWSLLFTCYLVFTWLRLHRIINQHIKSLEQKFGNAENQQIINMKKASRNVNIPVVIMTIGCVMSIVSNIAVSISYRQMAIFYTSSSINYFAAWYILNPVFVLICNAILVYNKVKVYVKAKITNVTGYLSNVEIIRSSTINCNTNNTIKTYVDNNSNREISSYSSKDKERSLHASNDLNISPSDNTDQIPSYENILMYPIAIECTEDIITKIDIQESTL
ncbi:17677_t:CDS:2 [Funneliformis geosporum]|uniref:2564_t:CDS:1 n=1 Tax=Funneliformis geosporum TaxID=1117311 RepID=A0A9W4SG75_9GLOM|nr:17677_t:CDS:2 [Funneliformis geosporum]CAI2168351.1 2564_t:CDS:2 [Funneliformis geosporum]